MESGFGWASGGKGEWARVYTQCTMGMVVALHALMHLVLSECGQAGAMLGSTNIRAPQGLE